VHELTWRDGLSGTALTDVLNVIAKSFGLELDAERTVRSTSASTSRHLSSVGERRSARGHPIEAVDRALGMRSATQFVRTHPPQDLEARPTSTVDEIVSHIKLRYTTERVEMDVAACMSSADDTLVPLVPIEIKAPGTIGLWSSWLGEYRLPVAAQAEAELREQLEHPQLAPQQLQQQAKAHEIMQRVLLTDGQRAHDGVGEQKYKYAALWQLLTYMLVTKTAYGVLTDAIMYVFVHIRWDGSNLAVEHYVRHRYDGHNGEPTVTACLAAVFKLAAEDAARAAPAANSWPSAIERALKGKFNSGSESDPQGAGPAPDGCALVC
jgi:hypothetical protein